LDGTGGLKGTDLAKAIAETRKFPGVTGVITIDKDRNAEKSAVVVEMKRDASGNLVPLFVTTIEPAPQ
ncbi:TPA: hypothetical protein ACLNKM_003695, partial [Vibrio cholerae O1]